MGNLSGKVSYNVACMSSPAKPRATPHPDEPTGLFSSLDHEWRILVRCGPLRARCHAWAVAEPALQQCPDPRALVSIVTWEGFQPSDVGSRALAALLRLAVDPLASRALLQTMLPRLRNERTVIGKYGHGVGDSWQTPTDTVADLVAECYSAIKRHAGEDRDDVARVLVQEATRRLRTARQSQRRYQARTVVLVPGHFGRVLADLSAGRSEAEWLAKALMDAVRSGSLTTLEAGLVYGTRVKGMPASEVGRCAGMGPRAVYYALARAERALLLSAA
jgi:hypothetical protein